MSRQREFMPSRYAGKPEEPPAPRPPVERERIRHRPMSAEEREAHRVAEILGEVRISGRHARDPLSRADLRELYGEDRIGFELIEATYAAGMRDRAAGVRCMCVYCLGQRDLKEENP